MSHVEPFVHMILDGSLCFANSRLTPPDLQSRLLNGFNALAIHYDAKPQRTVKRTDHETERHKKLARIVIEVYNVLQVTYKEYALSIFACFCAFPKSLGDCGLTSRTLDSITVRDTELIKTIGKEVAQRLSKKLSWLVVPPELWIDPILITSEKLSRDPVLTANKLGFKGYANSNHTLNLGANPIALGDQNCIVQINDQYGLLGLLSAFSGQVPSKSTESLLKSLELACLERKYWNDAGRVDIISVDQSGFTSQLKQFFSRTDRVRHAFAKLTANAEICVKPVGGNSHFSLSDDMLNVMKRQPQALRDIWKAQAMTFMCFVFPLDQAIEPKFGEHGRLLLPLLTAFDDSVYTKDFLNVIVAASRIGSLPQRQKMINKAYEFCQSRALTGAIDIPESTYASIAYRRSVLARFAGDTESSQAIIGLYWQEYQQRKSALRPSGDPRQEAHYRAAIGRLQLSAALNFLDMDRLDESIEVLLQHDYISSETPSALESNVIYMRRVFHGKYYHSKGEFEEARNIFKGCLDPMMERITTTERNTIEKLDTTMLDVASRYIQVLCECDETAVEQAMELGPKFLSSWQWQPAPTKGYRRLQVSLIEVQVRCLKYTALKARLDGLLAFYDEAKGSDILDDLIEIRARVCEARIAHYREQWEAADKLWDKVYNRMEASNAFKCPGYADSVVLLWKAHIQFMTGHPEASITLIKKAKDHRGKKQHHITGFGTYYLEYLSEELEKLLKEHNEGMSGLLQEV